MSDQTQAVPDDDIEDLKAADAGELHRTIREEGEEELERPASSLFLSALAAGLAISSSLLVEGALHQHLPDAPWRELVVALGYPIGFLIVILGRMQLFTESTVTAMLPLVTRPSRWALTRTLRLWGIVLGANLLGTALAAAAMAGGLLGSAELTEAMGEVSTKLLELGPGATVINAIPAGFLIAAVAWILPNARDQSFWIILAVTYAIGIAGFSHSVVGSDQAFLLLFTGAAGFGQTVLLLAAAVLGNLVGGAGLFALLAHGQVRPEGEDA
jgi:formate-nitrite transporter family protein